MNNLVYVRIATARVAMRNMLVDTPSIVERFVGGSIKLGTTPGGGARAGALRILSRKVPCVFMMDNRATRNEA
jgi:hypothetical protein